MCLVLTESLASLMLKNSQDGSILPSPWTKNVVAIDSVEDREAGRRFFPAEARRFPVLLVEHDGLLNVINFSKDHTE